MRRIARDLGLARDTVQSVVRRWEAEARRHGIVRGRAGPRAAEPGGSASTTTIRQLLQRYPDITITRVFEELRAQRLSRRLHASSASACCELRPQPLQRAGGHASRRRRVPRPRWITAPTTSTSPTKAAAACTCSATCWATRGGSTCVSSRRRTSTTLREHIRAFEHLGGVAAHLPVRQHEGRGLRHDDEGPLYNPQVPGLRHALWLHAAGLPRAAAARRRAKSNGIRLCRRQPAQRPHLPHAGTPQRGDGLVAGQRRRRAHPSRDQAATLDRHAEERPHLFAVAGHALRRRRGRLPRRQRRRLRRLPAEPLLGPVAAHRPGAAGAHHRDRD